MAYSEKIAGSIEKYLKEQDFTYDYDAFHGTFSVEAELSCRLRACLVVLQVTENAFLSYAAIDVTVPPRRIDAVGEFLHRANYGLPNGNFEIDYDDGSVHFRTYLDCPDEAPTEKQLDDAFAVPLSVIDHYGDGLLRLVEAGTSVPAGIINEIDGQQ